MSRIIIRNRGKYFEYRIEIAQIEGKRKWLSKSGYKNKQEAYEAGTLAYSEYKNAGVPFKPCNLSYSDYLDYWTDNYCKTNLKYNTTKTYQILINKYIKPTLGIYKLSTITSVTLNTFITDMVMKYNFSRTYYKNILKVIKGSFRDACNIYGFIKYNPSITIRLPKIELIDNDVKHLYTNEEIDLIINKFKDNSSFICPFLTSYYTGMRTGEVFALTWEDIDFKNNIINVKHSIYDKNKDNKGRWYLGTTKTKSGIRKIYMCETLKQALLNYKNRQEYLKTIYGNYYKYYKLEKVLNEYGKELDNRIVINNKKDNSINLIFTKDDGTYVGTDLIKYPYKIIHNELGISKCRFYDLRGSYATRILNNGVEIKNVADILGHRNIETTENYYISSTDESRRDACNVLEKINTSQIIKEAIKFEIGGANELRNI